VEDPGIADVNDTGLIEAKKTGETNVLVRTAGRALAERDG